MLDLTDSIYFAVSLAETITVSDSLSQILHLKAQQGATKISWDELNNYLSNSEKEHYDRESFVVAYNADQRLQNLVNNFDEDGVVLAGGEAPQMDQPDDDKSIDSMADRATKNALK